MSIDERTPRWGAHTSGANAVRIGLFDDEDYDDDYDDGGARSGNRYARTRASRDTTTPSTRATPRARMVSSAPRRSPAPPPRRGRTPWVTGAPEAGRAGVTGGPEAARRAAMARGPAVRLLRAPFALLVAALVVVGVVGVLVLNTKITENSFRLGDLRQTQEALSLQEQQLEQQLADLSSPGNLRAAATRLGLVPAGAPAYISLPDGRVVGVPQPAAGAQASDR